MPRPLRSQFRLTSTLALACLASSSLLACRTPSSKIPLDELTTEDQARNEGEVRDAVEPLPVERPTDMLPAEVAFMAEAIDPAAVLALLGPLDKYPQLSAGRLELSSRLGGDILNAEQWAQLGLDSHAPAGLGLLDVGSEGMFLYLSLIDAAVFEQTVLRVADLMGVRETLASAEVGDAQIYRLNEELSVVVREKVAMVVFVDDPEDAPRDYAVTAATIDPRESLGHAQNFSWARQQLQAVDDGMIYLDPSGLLRQIEQDRNHGKNDYGIRYAEDELAQARTAGDPPARIRELEERIEEERLWQREREAREAGERELVRSFVGSIGAVFGAADLRDDGIVAHGRLLIPDEGLLRRLFVATERESPLLTALAEPPVFALDGRVDLQVLVEVVELIARAEGDSLAAFNAKLLRETGVDVLADLIPALTGEGGFTLTESRKPDLDHLNKLPLSFGFAAHAGLANPDAIRRVLDNVARLKQMSGFLDRAKRGDGWVLHVPQWRDVELTIVGDRLVAATDSKLAKRVRDAEPGAQAKALAATEHPFRGPLVNPAMRMYGRWSGFALLNARTFWEQDVESMLYDINTHHSLSPDEAAKVPRSREYKRKLKELDKIVAELNEFNRRRTVREFERVYDFSSKLGDAGMQVEPLADGLGVEAQWRFTPGTTPFELGMMWFGLTMGDSDRDWAAQERIMNRSYAVIDELRTIRQADLDAAAAKHQ